MNNFSALDALSNDECVRIVARSCTNITTLVALRQSSRRLRALTETSTVVRSALFALMATEDSSLFVTDLKAHAGMFPALDSAPTVRWLCFALQFFESRATLLLSILHTLAHETPRMPPRLVRALMLTRNAELIHRVCALEPPVPVPNSLLLDSATPPIYPTDIKWTLMAIFVRRWYNHPQVLQWRPEGYLDSAARRGALSIVIALMKRYSFSREALAQAARTSALKHGTATHQGYSIYSQFEEVDDLLSAALISLGEEVADIAAMEQ